MASAARLYTPEVLALATGLAAFPWDQSFPLQGAARSRSCGSAITLGMSLDAQGRIERVGLKSQACAIGQAASAIFAAAAQGRDAGDIADAENRVAAWLAGEGDMPDWPGLGAIAAAREHPARHSAIMLPWKAAREILCSGGSDR